MSCKHFKDEYENHVALRLVYPKNVLKSVLIKWQFSLNDDKTLPGGETLFSS